MTVYHGLHDWYEAKHIVAKVFWAFIILVGAFFAILQSTEFVLAYAYDGKWTTTVSAETPEKDFMPWPNMSICGLNALDGASLNKVGLTDPYQIAFAFEKVAGMPFYDQFQADVALNSSDPIGTLYSKKTTEIRNLTEGLVSQQTVSDLLTRE